MTAIIGLTGGIASGKSLVSAYLKDLGIDLIDADLISRQLVERGQPALKAIVQQFGADILLEDGQLDRGKLGQMVFSSEQQRKKLEDILHPLIRKEIIRQLNQLKKDQPSLIVLDIPLLYESKYDDGVDQVWVVAVDEATQKQRLMKRNHLSSEEACQRIQAQMPLDEKMAKADKIIDNNGRIEDTYRQVDRLLHPYAI